MGYSLNAVQAEAVLQALKQNYSVYAPKRFPKQGRYSDTDVIKYPYPAGHLLLHRG